MTERNLYLFGYSGHALVVKDCLNGLYHLKGYFAPEKNSTNPLQLHYEGYEDQMDLNSYRDKGSFFPAIGNNKIRKHLHQLIMLNQLQEMHAIHNRSIVSETALIGLSTMIGPACIVNAGAEIGSAVILNSGSIIEHECRIANYVHVAPGAILAGNVSVGEGSFIGAGAVIREGVKIGVNCVIGAGAVVLNNVPDNELWAGVPAQSKKKL
jgi:sugar O-acyltransferase (sialic acid O-acetyltransferase NeuD family)